MISEDREMLTAAVRGEDYSTVGTVHTVPASEARYR